jgi:hypothetical protein
MRNRNAHIYSIRWTVIAFALTLAGLLLALSRSARADVIAGFVQGQGGLSSSDATTSTNRISSLSLSSGLAPGLGFQVGARLLFVEGYYDRTSYGSGASTQRGIVGVRWKMGLGDYRLVLRAGGGFLTEHGGAISGSAQGGDRRGPVARAGVAIEKRLTRGELTAGLGLDGEVFSLDTPSTPNVADTTFGGDLFLSLHLRFELGI